ncbi:ABC transporter [Lysinibacillus sphaericus]|uniref:ABC transporter ATP-binding protein n=1 Tax=Lysinibacillus sphaericus TaxID=1421 RepID=UPI0018CE53FE|nr:ABC transporter ATP-binding protein [Lysinibacillus sphaericus]MBG9455799.1 ABC transporter [Lysinibacillus sphaericus]MBG9477818.1 ABC transporter [Lysinibacillus sphaericus]MBG9593277.1 ABC transporter [Lysinibacillus sphaericus]
MPNTQNKPQKDPIDPGNMMVPGEKPINFKKPWGKLIAYCKPYLPATIFALVLATVGTIFTIIGPNMLSDITDLITDGITGEIDITAIGKIGLFLAILYGLSFIFNYLQAFIMATITQRVSKKLRTDISNKIDRLPLKYFDSTTYGDVLSRVTNDVDMIGQSLNQSIGSLVTAVVMFFGSLIMMFSINVTMTLSALAATLVGFVLMTLIMSRSRKYFIRQQQDLGRINGHIEEIYSGHDVMKVYNGEKVAKQEFNEINESLFNSAWRAQFMSGMMMPLMIFIGNLGYVVVCVVGAALIVKGSITFGVIVSFMVYISLFTQPLSQLAQAATSLQVTAAASERVFEFLQEEELEDERDKKAILDAKDVTGNVQFKNVKFGYTKEKLIIKDFSAQIKAGQKVAIVGPTGAGKTTLVNLLMRFYEVDSGEIMIGDVPTKSISRKNVHDLFCMVLQDTWLFEGTVKENIVYNKENVTDEEVITACKAVGLHHFIRTLPKGYDTILNDKTSLSVGQKQLITIARAMVKKAPLLILDEATSSVDTRTEALIQEAMDKLMVGRTSFVIAHRLSTIKNADLILVMKDGDIIESGNHEELIAEKGFYADLYNSQFEDAS